MQNKTLKQFNDLTASKEPVPGGGGVCANVAALAAALGEMVTNLTIGKPKYFSYTTELTDIKKELDVLRINLLDCINKDADAFFPLSQAYKMDRQSPNYQSNLENCLIVAVNSPLLIMKYCSRIIDVDERLAIIGSKISVSDAATSVMLAHGAMFGAYINILVNTRLMQDQSYARTIEDEAVKILNEYSRKATNCYDRICKRLSNG